jgi:hypothetical protein
MISDCAMALRHAKCRTQNQTPLICSSSWSRRTDSFSRCFQRFASCVVSVHHLLRRLTCTVEHAQDGSQYPPTINLPRCATGRKLLRFPPGVLAACAKGASKQQWSQGMLRAAIMQPSAESALAATAAYCGGCKLMWHDATECCLSAMLRQAIAHGSTAAGTSPYSMFVKAATCCVAMLQPVSYGLVTSA